MSSDRSSPKKRKKKSSQSNNNNSKAKIKVVEDDAVVPSENPIVVSFPGGLPESIVGGNLSGGGGGGGNNKKGEERPRFLWQKLHEKATKNGRRIIGEDRYCTYSASVEDDGSKKQRRATKLCVGVYSKKRGVVVIREAAANGTVFTLKQTVPSYLQRNGTINVDDPTNNQRLDYNQVFEDFGSAKKQRVLKSQAANQVDIDNVVGAGEGSAVVMQVTKGQSMSESNRKAIEASRNNEESGKASNAAVEASYEKLRQEFLPEYDKNADKPHTVYSGKAIVGEKAWDRVSKQIQNCMRKDDYLDAILKCQLDDDWLPSIVKVIKKVPADDDSVERYTCAMLVNSMIRFLTKNINRRTIPSPTESKSMWFGIPTEIAILCIQRFTTPMLTNSGKSTQAMSKHDRDKCLVHVLLLYLKAHGKSMSVGDLNPIATDMNVGVHDCAQVLRLAGCTVLKKGTSFSAVLKTPLKFPPPKKAGASSRGRK